MNEVNLPAIEPVTDEDVRAAVRRGEIAVAPFLQQALEQDRRRVAERRAGRQGDYNPASLSHEAANAELAHISGTISDAREIERLRAEVARLTAANGWQPIETAPKCDCCPPVDAWVKSCLLGRFDGHGWITWVGQMDSGMWLEGNSRRSYGDSEMPTHWMPLPPPPTATSAEKESGNG